MKANKRRAMSAWRCKFQRHKSAVIEDGIAVGGSESDIDVIVDLWGDVVHMVYGYTCSPIVEQLYVHPSGIPE